MVLLGQVFIFPTRLLVLGCSSNYTFPQGFALIFILAGGGLPPAPSPLPLDPLPPCALIHLKNWGNFFTDRDFPAPLAHMKECLFRGFSMFFVLQPSTHCLCISTPCSNCCPT